MYTRPGETPPPLFSAPVPIAKPFVTYGLIGVLGVIWLLTELTGGSTNVRNMVNNWGANFAPLVSEGEYWRLITANFLHWGVTHLLFNCWSLYAVGAQVESLYGWRRFVAIYVLTGISGAFASYLLLNGLSAGASTAIFGLVGTLGAYYVKHRHALGGSGRAALQGIGLSIVVNLVVTFSPGSNIDFWGHFGGFLGGIVLGWFLAPRYEQTDPLVYSFGSALRGFRKPELANSQITDANTIGQQALVLAVFFVVIAAATIGVSLTRQPTL
jgi:rhomboid protease GluP